MLAVVENNIDGARSLVAEIPEKYHDFLAKFLDQIDQKEEAFSLVNDLEFKQLINRRFDLAVQLNLIDEALEIAQK